MIHVANSLDVSPKSFGKRLSSILKERNISKGKLWAEVAKQGIELGPFTIYTWASGQNLPSIICAIGLARALGMSVEELVLGTGTKHDE